MTLQAAMLITVLEPQAAWEPSPVSTGTFPKAVFVLGTQLFKTKKISNICIV